MLKRLLVGVSGSPALKAKIDYSIDLAVRHGATIQLVDIVDVDRIGEIGPIPLGAGHYAHEMVAHRIEESHHASDSALREFAERCHENKVPVETITFEGDPLPYLARLWRYADLCLLGARGWFDHNILKDPESVLGQVIATGVRPILAVPESHRAVRRIAVLYNGTIESAKAIKQFVGSGLYPDARKAEVLCVGDSKTGEPAERLLSDIGRYLELHGYEPTLHQVMEGGDRIQTALDFVHDHDCDLIVMGGSYHRVLLSRRFGRATIGILRRSDVPVFVSH